MQLILDALFFRLRNCGPWRDLPPQYGPWQTIYGWHRTFARNGLWLVLLKSFVKKVRGRVVLVDGTHILAHQARPTRRAVRRRRRWARRGEGATPSSWR